MNDTSRVLVSTLIGAAIGGLVGYLYLTPGGRRLRDEIEPRLDDFSREVRKLRSAITKAQAVADESWRSFNELVAERPKPAQFRARGEA